MAIYKQGIKEYKNQQHGAKQNALFFFYFKNTYRRHYIMYNIYCKVTK